MMNKIETKFSELRKNRKKALIVYVCAGDPDIATTKRIVLELDRRGVDIIELGIPFSDPMADGPVIQAASNRALGSRTTIQSILSMVRSLKGKVTAAVTVMTYYNPIFKYGLKKFVNDAKAAGIDGAIVPDLPAEESDELSRLGRERDFSVILLTAPTTRADRLKKITRAATGFVYYVSLTGVTGAKNAASGDIAANVRRIKKVTDKPVCVGFGVSTPDQARDIARYADGVIVGSAVIRVIEKNLGKSGLVRQVGKFAGSLSTAVKGKKD